MMYLQLYDKLTDSKDRQSFLENAVGYLQPPLRHLGSGVYTFLCGDAGTLALGAVALAKMGDDRNSKECIDR